MNKELISQRDCSTTILQVLFFLSGASSLIFETIFTRLLTYTFGNTAYAVSTVLASFLGGLAVGAFVLGGWLDRRAPSLRFYGGLELLIGVYCLFIPSLFGWLTESYVALYYRLQLGTAGLTTLRVGLSCILILVPSFLMGGTLPAIARFLAARRSDFQSELDRFYALNTLGAASGVLISTYALIPVLGIRGTIVIASSINILIAIASNIRALSQGVVFSKSEEQESRASLQQPTATMPRVVSGILLLSSFLTGAVALGYEVVWTHVLGFLVGNTVYAFGLMLFTVLAGLGLGAHIAANHLSSPSRWLPGLTGSQVALGLTVFISLPLWPLIPALFAQGVSGAYNRDLLAMGVLVMARITYVFLRNRRENRTRVLPRYRTYEAHILGITFAVFAAGVMPFLWKYETTFFLAGELLRFLCVFGLLIVPAILMGLSFPLLLNLYSRGSHQVGRRIGSIYAVNTAGTVLGSLAAGFLLLPRLGSVLALRSAGMTNAALGLVFALVLLRQNPSRKWLLPAAAVSLALLLFVPYRGWDIRKVTGTYAYFDPGWRGQQIVFAKEDIQGGLTSVAQIGSIRTLLSNGKFQGDNAEEIITQTRFALIPALFTQQFDRALVIGLGTGNTLRTVAHLPFRRVDAVELAPQVVEAARQWFSDVNDRVFDHDLRVKLSVGDGRNFLLLSRERYDMITIEVTSLWVSGEADLYNREFYELCRSHLSEHGVLQQWVALHHLRTRDLLVILNTAAQVFPHIAFFQGANPGHGLLIASSSPLQPDYARIAAFDEDAKINQDLQLMGLPSMWSLLGELVLYDHSYQQAISSLPAMTGLPRDFSSTDLRPYLEYQVPKGITLSYDTVKPNSEFLQRFRIASFPPELAITNLPSENERNLIFGYIAERRGDFTQALSRFKTVEGPDANRAQREMLRVHDTLPNSVPGTD